MVMCHTDPAGIARTLRSIRRLSPGADIVVRHSVPGLVTPELLDEVGATALRSEIQIVWGDWTMTRAALEALERARGVSDADHVVLVSGQDHPIRDLAAWEEQVRADGGDAMLDVFPPMTDDWHYRWWLLDPPHVGPVLARRGLKWGWRHVAPSLRSALMLYQGRRDPRWILGIRRPGPARREPPVAVLKASLWMTLSARAVDSVLARHRAGGPVLRFFERVRIPDESYLQSLLLADPQLRIIDCPTAYAYFPYDHWSPAWVDAEQLARAARTPAAFARKVPEDVTPELVAAMEALTRRPAAEVPPVRDAEVGEAKLTGAELRPGEPPVATGLPPRVGPGAALGGGRPVLARR
ncbi:hypothetical protein ADJ73_01710 [Arsenicicoccus sp. oral taxon 190]|nr:hypothetical protein ADJ73_01710 [Arsenicicoccus sp. oral taxon 190]